MPLNLDDLFAVTARRQPTHVALLGPGPENRLTYGQLDAAIDAASQRLFEAGVRPGHCVGLHCRSGANYIILNYAVWRNGGCVVPIPVELAAAEKERLLQTIAIDCVIDEGQSSSFLRSTCCGPIAKIAPGMHAIAVSPLRRHPDGFAEINSAFIRFTSGTTASAKGVVLSHETIYERIQAANDVLCIGPNDRVLWLLSMAYHFAVSIAGYLTLGAGIVLVPHHFAPAVLDAGRRHRPTLLYGSPGHFAWLAADASSTRLDELRLAISTTAAIDRGTAQRFQARMGVPVRAIAPC